MASVTYRVDGLADLGKRLAELRADVAGKIATAATGAAARAVKKRAIANVNASPSIDTGALRDAVIVKKLGKRESTLTSEHIVTVRHKRGRKQTGNSALAPHAVFVEFGTVNMPAEPFLRPAITQGQAEAISAMTDRLKKRIAKAEGGRR